MNGNFSSAPIADLDARLQCYRGVMSGRQPGHFEELVHDLLEYCPQVLQTQEEVARYSPSDQLARFDLILKRMEQPEFGRAVAMFMLVNNKVAAFHELAGKTGEPAAGGNPDDTLSDEALNEYAATLKDHWRITRTRQALQNEVYSLYNALETESDASLRDRISHFVQAAGQARNTLEGFAGEPNFIPDAQLFTGLAAFIEERADALRDHLLAENLDKESVRHALFDISETANLLIHGPAMHILEVLRKRDSLTFDSIVAPPSPHIEPDSVRESKEKEMER